MSELFMPAFLMTPAIVVVIGDIAVRLQEAAGRRSAAAAERDRRSTRAPS